MRPLRVARAVGQITRLFGFSLLLPIPFAFAFDDKNAFLFGGNVPWTGLVFFFSFLLAMLISVGLSLATRSVSKEDLKDKEAYLTVGIGWIVLCILAAIPFWANGTLVRPMDAFFEAMSGLTTTGATVITGDFDAVEPSIMIWRAFLQYLGGMGIIVLSVALLARLTQGGVQLLQAEAPGPHVTRLRPKLAQTAKTLWAVYGVFSAIAFVALFVAMKFHVGLGWGDALYDAMLHTFTSISTGGFSNHSVGIAFFDSWVVEAILILVMVISASNYSLHYHVLQGDWRRLLRDREWQFFVAILGTSTLAIVGLLYIQQGDLGGSIRDAVFTVAAIGTGTGYHTADYDTWADTARLFLIILMFTGGMAGSTTGGLKVVRILILLKVVRREIRKLLHPRAVIPVRLGGKPLKEETVMTVIAFFFSFITIWMVGTILAVTTDPALDLFDGAVGAASMVSNVGPAMGVIGPTDSYAELLPSTKFIFAIMMWVGRLEVFTAMLLFSPGAWKN